MDEEERMIDMGFEKKIRKIIEKIRNDRKVMMWYDKWNKEVSNLEEELMNE